MLALPRSKHKTTSTAVQSSHQLSPKTSSVAQPTHHSTDLILERAAAKGPDTGEDKVQLIQLLGAVRWCVLFCQQALQQVTQHLYM